ncbi:hypothetical protein QQZ08_002960 [Neonectria magnoliae]|uniref:BZIP domain-containing protein n=1 Tax=Neonectria magnoliae TaxID=2732573 RepID=A0ABR1IC64_9HYPO
MESRMVDSQPARRGRPPLEEQDGTRDNSGNKTQRMRLAQRAYRARKEGMLVSERARTEQLSKALDQAFATFSNLYQQLVGSPGIQDSPPLAHLNTAAAQMMVVAHGVNKDLGLLRPADASRPSTQQHLGHQAFHPSKAVILSLRTDRGDSSTLSERIFRACLERVIPILSSGRSESRSPALTLPLDLLGEEILRLKSLQTLSLLHLAVADFQYLPHSVTRLPQMYRVVEGGSNAIRRLPAPLVQQIFPGKTRTRLVTASKPLQGEWLEAVDVEEYLQERGIHLRSGDSHETVAEIEHGTGSTISWPDHEPGDYSLFGLPIPQRGVSPGDYGAAIGTGLVPVEASNTLWTDFSYHGGPPASQITIDLDRLVELLAANAVCLGPVPGIRQAAVDASIRESAVVS